MEDIELSEAARALFEAPFGVLAHEFQAEGPPTFVYANQASRPSRPATVCAGCMGLWTAFYSCCAAFRARDWGVSVAGRPAEFRVLVRVWTSGYRTGRLSRCL